MNENKISIKNEFNENLVGIETVPNEDKKSYPTVILVHGFGVTKEEGGMFDEIAEKLAENGILSYRFDFSGRGESEGDYSETSLTKLKSDLSKILEFVKSQDKIDKDNIGILSQSFGTSVTVALEPQVKAIVLMGSLSHPKELLAKIIGKGYNPEGITLATKSTGEKIEIKPKFWKDFENHDLLKSITKIDCPILFVHGSEDEKIPVSDMEEYYKLAKIKDKLILEGARHSLKPKRDEVYKGILNYFNKYLKEEKVFFKNKRDQKLCGILAEPTKKDEIVIILHGFSSHKNTSARISASTLTKLNINSLRIDFSGCGESEGDFEKTLVSEYVEDVEATINFVKEKGYKKISLIGTSFGGLISLIIAVNHPEIQKILLRAPVSNLLANWEWKNGKEEMEQWKKQGYIPKFSNTQQKHFKLHYKLLEDAKANAVHDKSNARY